MGFDWISIVFLAIVVLFLVIGLFRGLMKTIIDLLSNVVLFLVSLALCGPLANLMVGWGWGNGISASFEGMLSGMSGADTVLDGTNNISTFAQAYESINIPSFVSNPLAQLTNNLVGPVSDVTLGAALASFFTIMVFRIIAFVAMFIILLVVVLILKKVFKKLRDIKIIKVVDVIGGAVAGAVLGAFVVILIAFVIDLSLAAPGFGDFFNDALKLTDDSYWSIGKWLVQSNFLKTWFLI